MEAIIDLGFFIQPIVKQCKLVRWIPPLQGLVLNVDGASKGNPGPCGGGGLVRNGFGAVLLAFFHFYGTGNSLFLLKLSRVLLLPGIVISGGGLGSSEIEEDTYTQEDGNDQE
ncbi:hypothetical protein Taro_048900 [Colocasia esculenta]|uniref:Uncharacterized protein n=1 Tax=Colocasia esculenta TaxID=4460 RepID=A0A843X9H2_COLES|nr:hypothetical protein [Colocasia esculenta]